MPDAGVSSPGIGRAAVATVDPANGKAVATFEEHTAAQIEDAVAEVHVAQRDWAGVTPGERARLLLALGQEFRTLREELARLVTIEMGKPVVESIAEMDKCAWACDFYAAHAAGFLADREVRTDAQRSFVRHRPTGVVLAVMPWNYPFWQVMRFAAPALMAGNGILLKHAANVPQCALAVEDLMRRAGFPVGLLRTLLVSEPSAPGVVEGLLADPRVSAVTLTGSARAGSAVAAAAGRNLKKAVLELGGSDPFIVLADADLPTAAAMAVRGRFLNVGQSCIAAKRFIVEDAVAEEFEERFRDAVAAMTVGDPLDPETQVGPMARADLLEALERQVAESVAMGARVVLGGGRLDRPGHFFAPTILADAERDMPVFAEETFGPLAAIRRVPDAESAIAVANDTEYGLGATIWTADTERAERLGERIESGMLFVNRIVASDPNLPFGGIKRSGFGRELSSEGMLEFVNVRTFSIGPATGQAEPSLVAE
jgi:succinate-semialdehyde dehydrogenase/glutarate-semialdehyde dehydrogenase